MDNRLPIDIVITWVEGNDLKLKAKRQQFINQEIAQESVSSTRFASNNEIYFCIASILKYMPEAGTIYLVTDQQKPEWLDEFVNQQLCTPDKIKVIDHMELFKGYENALPVFNSLSIETMFWNIDELSDQFIYLNDDVFFNAPFSRSDCFEQDKVIIYGHWKKNTLIKVKHLFRQFLSRFSGKQLKPKFTVAQMLSAERAGLNQYYELHHRPHFMQKHILKDYFAQHTEILNHQISFRFRDIEQFLPVGLSNHLSIQKGKAILKPDTPVAYVKPRANIEKFVKELEENKIQYGCIQSLDEMDVETQHIIFQAMVQKFAQFLPQQIKKSI